MPNALVRDLPDDVHAELVRRVAVEDLLALPVVRVPSGPLMRRAYELRANLTAYDAAYVALAEALDCALLTADARLARAPGLRCPVELIGLEVRPHHRRDPTRGRLLRSAFCVH